MIALVGASAIYLIATQAAINAPRDAFRACLTKAGAQARTEKVAPDAYEAFIRNACTGQMTSLKTALIGFEVKNGTSRKSATDDADMTIDDYVGSSVDNYKFMASVNQPAPQAAPAATSAPTPAAIPASAPKPPR